MLASSPQHRKEGMRITPQLIVFALSILALLSLIHSRFHVIAPVIHDQRVINPPTHAPAAPDSTLSTKETFSGQQPINGTISIDGQDTAQGDNSVSNETNLEEYPPHKDCVIYDRPTRTGSTTISKKLKSCLAELGYRFPKPYPKDGKAGLRMVPRMLRQNATRVALSGSHIRILQDDVDDVLAKCENILFITSCAPMLDRMWSGVKFELGDSSISRNRNTTISVDKEEAMRRMLAQERFEDAREAYPFVDVNNKPLVMRRKLIPDYVIRKERIEEDFKPLLEAFGCSSEIESRNVHEEADESIKSVIKDVPLKHNDKAYLHLSQLAKNNDNGLEKARSFG